MNMGSTGESRIQMPGMSMDGLSDNQMKMPGMKMGGSSKGTADEMDMGGMDMSRPELTPSGGESSLDQAIPPTLRPAIDSTNSSQQLKGGVSYTLEQLRHLALNNNPTLIQARAQVNGEKGKALQAGLFPNPDLSYVGDLLGLRTAGGGEFQGGVISQEVILGGKLKYSRKKYQARSTAAEAQEVAQRFRVLNDVAGGFYHVLAAAERVRIQREFMKSTRDSWITTREMYNLGQANQADLHQLNVDLERQNLRLKESVNELQLVWQQLMAIVGIDAEYAPLKGSLDDAVPAVDWSNTLARLLDQSPELGEARAKLQADKLTVQREHRQRIPNLMVNAGPGYDQLDRSFATVATASVTNIPIFNRNQGTIKQAEADLERQKAQVRLIELQLKTRLAMQYKHYVTARQHVDAYKEIIIPEAKKRYEVCLESYADTRLDWPAVLDAQRDFLNDRIVYVNHLLALHEASINIQGFLLGGGLEPPPGVTPPGHIDATPQPR